MSLTIKHLNSDSTFLLDFAPASTTTTPSNQTTRVPGTFTILIDPWLSGRSSVFHPSFQSTKHIDAPQITSLADLDQDLDLIIISQDKPDHCHRETLCSLPKKNQVDILATPAAAKKIKSWNFFDKNKIHILQPYKSTKKDSLLRIPLQTSTPTSQKGELTIAHLPTKNDLTRIHNAIAITYRPPSQTPHEPPTLSLLYTPHGIPPSTLHPYIHTHFNPTPSHPLTALLHAFNTERNPFLLGGEVMRGAPGGVALLRALGGNVRCWVGAHDGRVERGGWSTRWLRSRVWSAGEVEGLVRGEEWEVEVVELGIGGVVRLEGD